MSGSSYLSSTTETLAAGVPINKIETHLYYIRKSLALIEMLLVDTEDNNEILYPLTTMAAVLGGVDIQLDVLEKLCNHAYATSVPKDEQGGDA
ncbi:MULTISPECIES: hypothetical protein [unclassified Zymobacter]|uniref:hypothetical protein n=1 Tax=unclassified Zymobacter TaxID=3048685 RepID=UPI0039C2A69F